MANKPNNPSLWSRAKSLAKQKFDVYPSAYANGWAAKWYKSKGGTWRKAEYGMEVPMMAEGGKPDWLMEAQLKAQGYSGDALRQKMESMAAGGEPQNAGFQALPQYVQDKIMEAAFGGYIPEMAYGGIALQDVIDRLQRREEKLVAKGYKAVDEGRDKKADRILGRAARVEDRKIRLMENMAYGGMAYPFMDEGGEANGEMALGQMAAVSDKMAKLLQFVKPDDNLDPWIASKLAVMDHSADAISDYMMYGAEGDEEEMEEPEGLPMPEMKNGGGIPNRYKNMGFTKVGVKKNSTRPGKKWMVLAKKGDQYKVVHGGYDGMKDFSQHGSEKRKTNFWNRMGGKNSSKATDPFSPLYWHKRFGTWEEGGEVDDDYEMKEGGSTFSGNAWYKMGGMPCYECGGMFAYGGYLPEEYKQGGIYIDPKKKGTFKAQATRMGMGIQEAASAILNAPEGKYSPEMRRKANFARNFAKQDGGLVEGAEMEVTPEQAELLRQQGYDFEII